MRYELTDHEWAAIKPMLPNKPCGVPRVNDRRVLNGIFCGGVSGGLGYRGSLEAINRIAPADRRSEVVSSYLIALFAGNSLPVIGIGLLSAATNSLVAHVAFAALITALAGVAALTGIKYAPNE